MASTFQLQRHAMELLLWVACNVRSVLSAEDVDTLGALLRLRALKSKQINNLFNVALKFACFQRLFNLIFLTCRGHLLSPRIAYCYSCVLCLDFEEIVVIDHISLNLLFFKHQLFLSHRTSSGIAP